MAARLKPLRNLPGHPIGAVALTDLSNSNASR
jgi:hypothetical protein